MTDLLARIAFSEDSDFLAQALAPGLPMLDGRKLAYQVLLGWFGDMLAEPELDEDGVSFYVQSRGQRLPLAEHALATQSDLDGHLAGDYDRLKKALFDVRPVSPSERLIFNRLEPPIVNHDGFLYRVRPSGSSDRLVWCWGFQRRRSTGDVVLCPHDDCSLLFVRQETSMDICPRCERALFQQAVTVERRTSFPTGAVAATVMLSGLVGATYWIASVSGDEAVDAIPVLAAVSPPELDEPPGDEAERDFEAIRETLEADSGSETVDAGTASGNESSADDAAASEDLANLKPLEMELVPDAPVETRRGYGDEPLRPFAASDEPRRIDLPADANSFDPPQLVDRVPPEEKPLRTKENPDSEKTPEATTSRPTEPDATEAIVSDAPKVTDEPASPKTPLVAAPQTQSTESEPVAKTPGDRAELQPEKPVSEEPGAEPPSADKPASEPLTVAESSKGDSDPDSASKNDTDSPAAEPVATPGDWSTDYVAAYQRAIAERRYLIMLFRDADTSAIGNVSTADLPDVADLPGFGDAVRVVVPTTMTVPGQPAEAASRLLEHRSFRHLQGAAGIAIVDLTRTDSPNFGRVVSAFPAATDRQSIVDALQPAHSLPEGTISQRSLLLALRTGLSESPFADRSYDAGLNDLANRNARYMAHLDEAGLFETAQRRDAVREQFGENAQLRELVFASADATTIQAAARQAVDHWRSNGELTDDLSKSGVKAFGLELFQSPTNSRWFATLLIVTE